MSLANQQKSNITFYIIIAIFFSIIGLVILILAKIYPIFMLMVSNRGNSPCNCVNQVAFLVNHPYLSAFILLLTLVTIVFLLFIALRLITTVYSTKKFVNSVIGNKVKPSAKLIDILSSLDLERRVIQINSNRPEVFCFGFFRPMVCISSQLVNQVSKNQLRAVLLHEKNHIKSYDPLKLFLVNTVRKSLSFIPGLKKIINQFEVGLELSADERATNNFREIKSLGNALLKMNDLHRGYTNSNSRNLAVTFLSITEARIDRLINKSPQPKFYWFIPKLFVSLMLIVGLFAVVFHGNVWLAKASQVDMADNLSCNVMPAEEEYSWGNFSHCSYNSKASCVSSPNDELNLCY